MSYQNNLQRVVRKLSAHEQVWKRSEQVTRELARKLSAHEQVWRQSEQVTREAAKILSTYERVGHEAARIASFLNRFITEMGQQSELKWFANQILESEKKQKAKLPTPSTSNYCREWNWELYELYIYNESIAMSEITTKYRMLEDEVGNASTSSTLV